MEALKAEIERKRKASADAAAAAAGSGGPRKWMKASEREKVREAEYHAETAKEQERAKAKQVMPQFRYAQPDSSMSGGASSSADATEPAADSAAAKAKAAAAATEAAKALRPIEVRRLLRNLGQPIQLFGEEEADRLERYQAVSKILPSESEANDELKAGQMFDERQRFDESGKAIQKAAASEEHTQADEDAEGETLEELAGSGFVPSTPEDIVLVHFKTLVRMWEAELAARTEEEAGSLAGRTATGAFQQCKRHMKPFYKLLKAREMPLDVMGTMVEITTFMKSRDYVKAHDAYIRCAIGTAPWPMGITGTGVHERQGRQHLRESKIAHVMNDETQRKYLQSVKRLMTFSQRVLPPSGPSQMVG